MSILFVMILFIFGEQKKNELIVGKVKDSQKCNLTTCRQNALQEI